MAEQLDRTPFEKLEPNAATVKRRYGCEIRHAADTGKCDMTLWLALRMLGMYLPLDTTDIEGVWSVVKHSWAQLAALGP